MTKSMRHRRTMQSHCVGIEGYLYKRWKSCDPRIFRRKNAGDALLYPKDQDGTSVAGV